MHTNSAQDAAHTAPATTERADLDRLRKLDARAVRDSVALVNRLAPGDLARPTPCAGWDLAALLGHLAAQHHGFAAAALGRGRDLAHWAVRPVGDDATAAATHYRHAAEDVLAAFATVADPDLPFALPEFTTDRTIPAAQAIGFHLIDYVVHSWDLARSLDLRYDPGPELLDAALPIALAVPDGAARLAPGSSFRPGLPVADGTGTLDRILALLGRSADWRAPAC
ncbi:TIGR03086 family metal-binding protein [Streptomyces sp. NPDC039016]|uniref:TIGR03086 family metal-binding protein n=1 Tax=Streptomyces sp. NPDC039016 TaxID=3154330 RepID=UPI00340ED4FE